MMRAARPKLGHMAGVVPESELARRLEDAHKQQRAISSVLRAVARSAGLQPVLDEVVEACMRLCKAGNGALWLLENDLLVSVAHHGGAEAAEYDSRHPHAVDRTSAAGRTALTREPVVIPDIELDPEYTYSGPSRRSPTRPRSRSRTHACSKPSSVSAPSSPASSRRRSQS
jgi:hypothetical protein